MKRLAVVFLAAGVFLFGCKSNDAQQQEIEQLQKEIQELKAEIENLTKVQEESQPMTLDEAYTAVENYFDGYVPSNAQVNEIRLKKYNKHDDGEGIESIGIGLINTDLNRPYIYDYGLEGVPYVSEEEFIALYEEMSTYCNDVLDEVLELVDGFEGKIHVYYAIDKGLLLTGVLYYGDEDYKKMSGMGRYTDIFEMQYGYSTEYPTFTPWE